MSDRTCPIDGASLPPGMVVCSGCVARTRNRLYAVPGLLTELDIAITKQTSAGAGGAGDGVVFDVIASDAAFALRSCLHGWARMWDEETPGPPMLRRTRDRLLSTPRGQAAILVMANLGARVWAYEAAVEIRDATTRAWAAVDRPPDVVFVGWCPQPCGLALYAADGALRARCRACGSLWDVQASRDALLAAAVDVHATAGELVRALQVDPSTFRSWRRRGQLVAVAVTPDGRPLYRVSDVQALKSRG